MYSFSICFMLFTNPSKQFQFIENSVFSHCRCLDKANVLLKMRYGRLKNDVKKQFVGLNVEVIITDKNQDLKKALIEGIYRTA